MTTDFIEEWMECGMSFHMTDGAARAARATSDLEELKQDYKDPKNH